MQMFLSMQTNSHFQWNPPLTAQIIFSPISYTRQEHCETQMLRKRVKELETEFKQLQLECQVKESRVVDLESDAEVSLSIIWEWTYGSKCVVSLEWCHVAVWILVSFLHLLFSVSVTFVRNQLTADIYFWPAVSTLHFVILSLCSDTVWLSVLFWRTVCTLLYCGLSVLILVAYSPWSMLQQKPGLS